MIGRTDLVFYINGRFLGFEEKLPGTADAETIVGGFGVAADLDGIFMDDIFIRLGVALLIGDIPSERLEERIEKLPAQLGFVITLALVGLAVLFEPINEGGNERGRLTHNRQSLFVAVSVPSQNTPFPTGNHPAIRGKGVNVECVMMNGELRSPEGDGEVCPVYHPRKTDRPDEPDRPRAVRLRRREGLFSSLLLEWRWQDRWSWLRGAIGN